MDTAQVGAEQAQAIGDTWIEAITSGELERLAELCWPDVTSQLITPRRVLNHEDVAMLADSVHRWFGACRAFQVTYRRVARVGQRLSLAYAFRLQEDGAWFDVEQQVYAALRDGKIEHLKLLCSGFQPVSEPEGGAGEYLQADDVLVLPAGVGGQANTCALLTPAIKARLRALESGQVLEVRVDDLSARADIESWCRLSGNELIQMNAGQGQELQFFVRKK
jgi:TusA-related sulfurtransferase